MIITVLALLLLGINNAVQKNVAVSQSKARLELVRDAIEAYHADHGQYPGSSLINSLTSWETNMTIRPASNKLDHISYFTANDLGDALLEYLHPKGREIRFIEEFSSNIRYVDVTYPDGQGGSNPKARKTWTNCVLDGFDYPILYVRGDAMGRSHREYYLWCLGPQEEENRPLTTRWISGQGHVPQLDMSRLDPTKFIGNPPPDWP